MNAAIVSLVLLKYFGLSAHIPTPVSSGEPHGGEKFESVEFGLFSKKDSAMTSP